MPTVKFKSTFHLFRIAATICCLFLLFTFNSNAQSSENTYVDSLEKLIPAVTDDVKKIKLYRDLCWEHGFAGNMRTAIEYGNKAIALAKKTKNNNGLAGAYNDLGYVYYTQREYEKSLNLHLKSEAIYKKEKDRKGLSSAYGNLANLFSDQSDYPKALEYYFRCLKIQEELRDSVNIAITYSNIGNIYSAQENFDMALRYYKNAMNFQLKINDQRGLGKTYNNIGILYKTKTDFILALQYYQKSLEIKNRQNDLYDVASCYNNIAELYIVVFDQPDSIRSKFEKTIGISNTALLDVANSHLEKALQLSQKMSDEFGMAISLAYMGEVNFRKKEWQKTISNCNRSLALADSLKAYEIVQTSARRLAETHSQLKQFEQAYYYYQIFFDAKEKVKNDANTKEVTRKEMQYQFDKQQAMQKALQYKKEIENKEEIRRQKIFRNFFLGGFLLVAMLALVIFRSLKEKKKSNTIIQKQKELVEEKNKEILDSINYAKRLQEAILPNMRLWYDIFPESFVYYKPKDIVAGDFYWLIQQPHNNCILFAAADCTGHGVPGAMVSVVCSNALNRAVKEFNLSDPAIILDKVSELVEETFIKNESHESDVRDGMDISLCAYYPSQKKLVWAGANNPLWIVRASNENTENTFIEIKADKQPVGKFENRKKYKSHEIDIQKNDSIYLLTDGFADQFGGNGSKKYKSARLKQTLMDIKKYPASQQANMIHKEFTDWKKDLEQVDDICVIGITL